MTRVASHELVLVRGMGPWVWDEGGNQYLDAVAGLWYANVGYGRAELADAASRQLRQLHAYSTFEGYANRPALSLAERVSELAPIQDAVAFFTTGGSDAVETAAKIVRRYWHAVGKPHRRLIVARTSAYHGMNAFGTSLGGIPPNRAGYGPLVESIVHVPHDDTNALAKLFDERGESVAAFLGEPVVGAGGVHPPAAEYWPEVRRLCREHDVLLALDEVITGFGRLGTWFGAERFGIEPDILVSAKGITSGYVPLGVVVCGQRVQEPFWRGEAGVFRHGYTYSGHAGACAVALTNLNILEREHLLDRVRALEPALAAEVHALTDHPAVGEVRSIGLMAGIELATEVLESAPDFLERVVAHARARGVLIRGIVGRVLQLSPPFVVTEADLAFIGQTLRTALDAALRSIAEREPTTTR
jgi:adenosylmethionine-8-amino-7-oxononanoate aminotransferase